MFYRAFLTLCSLRARDSLDSIIISYLLYVRETDDIRI